MGAYMKIKILVLSTVVWSMALISAQAASWIVWPGESLQAAITNASPGDNITLKEGNYIEDIVLNKGLDIRGEPGKELTTSVHGTLTITNSTQPVYLRGFEVGVSRSGNILVRDCVDVRMDYITASPASLTATGSKIYLYRSSISANVYFDSTDWTAQRCSFGLKLDSVNSETKLLASTVGSNFVHHNDSYDCTVFQSTIGQKLTVNATNQWIGYSNMRWASLAYGGLESAFVGNRIDGQYTQNEEVQYGLKLSQYYGVVANNIIKNIYWYRNVNIYNQYGNYYYYGSGVWVVSGNPIIINNVIDRTRAYANNSSSVGTYYLYNAGCSISVEGGSPRILGNILQNASSWSVNDSSANSGRSVFASSATELRQNIYTNGIIGGVVAVECLNADPKKADDNWNLQVSSPAIDAGPPEAEYNDLDNTRNDMGVWGGHIYDPDGLTTTNPVVIWSKAQPLYVKRGQTIQLKARGAVAAD